MAPPVASPERPVLDSLLAGLRRRSWDDPATAGAELLHAAAGALGADALVLWRLDDAGAASAMLRHQPRADDAAEPVPDRDALLADGVAAVERRVGRASRLDVGIWTRGALTGALTVRRRGRPAWDEAERAFLTGLADRLAQEELAGERGQAEQALHERRQQMDLIEELAGLGSWEMDLQTDRVRWSREQRRIHGVDEAGAPATHAAFMAMVHPDDRRVIDEGMAALAGGEPVSIEFRVERPDGVMRRLQARARIVPAADGRAARVLGTSLDVTERRDAERILRDREEQVNRLERLAEIGSWKMDVPTGRIVWSREQLRIHGLPLDRPHRSEAEFLALVHPDDRPRIVDVMTRLVLAGEPFHVEYRIVRPDGQVRLLEAVGQLVPGPDGRLTSMIGTSHDITERRATELALRVSEESYRTIFDCSNDAIFIHDPETGAVLDANQRAGELTTASLDDLRRDGLAFIANGPPPFTPDRALEHMRRAASGDPLRFEWMLVHPRSGEETWLEVNLQRVAIRGEDRLLALVRDSRERKRAEQALQASEASYRAIFESADPMWLHDRETAAILEVNPAGCAMFGYSADEQRALGLEGLFAPEHGYTMERAWESTQRCLAGEIEHFEWLGRHKDGHLVWSEMRIQRVTLAGRECFLATARDITARKAAERALRASEESYRLIFQHGSDGLWLHDVNTGEMLDVNDAACELLGYSADEIRAMDVGRLSDGTPPYTMDEARAHIERAAAGEPQQFEWHGRHRDGHDVWLDMRLRRVRIGDEDRILATARDIAGRKAAEDALREANEQLERRVAERTAQLRETQRVARIGSWQWDVATNVVTWDDTLAEIYGVAPEDAPHDFEGYLALVHPDDRSHARAVAERSAITGEPYTFDHRVLPADGGVRHLHGRGTVVRGPDGALVRMVGSAQDVTERKQAELALAEREEHFRRLIENSSDMVLICDAATGAITYVGPSVERILGFTPGEMMGLRPPDNMHPDDIPHVAASIAYLAEHPGEVTTTRYRTLHRDGSWRVHETMARTLAPDSADAGIVANCRDVTDRLAAERALRERDERFRRIIENTSDYVMMCDADARITYVSPSGERMLGWTRDEMLGAQPPLLVHPDDLALVFHDVQWIFEHPGQSLSTTYRIRHRDGSYRAFESVGRTVSPDSADEGLVTFARDVTERQEAEAALARAKDEAERANRAKSEFLSRMSHELRTPMNSILGFAQLLGRAELPPPQAKSVQHILKAGRHLLHLINEVLEIARIEAGREDVSLEAVALAPLLQEAMGLVRPLAQQWSVELREGPCPRDVFVHADRQRLVQVLLNLLSNAIKYNRPGGYVRLGCVTAADGRWVLRVEDGGRGIPADRVDQLFTPFARLGAEQTEVEGTGLGLALSRRLCEAMGGSLSLESSDERGSVFRLDLRAASDPLHALEETGTWQVPTTSSSEATLLYVEDNLANLSLVDTILLSRPGWRTLPALQGRLGVELAREHLPDVILLDLHLPDIPGDEVLRRLRADPRTAAIPIIIVSADATPTSVDRLRTLGADAYLTKPLDVDEFLRAVERFLPDALVAGDGEGAP